ncbi:STAS domain-containing protein [Nitratidesulfovibrio sp. SRB-5]|uniref:STAS domain-containing protein n=1 Tax=Nitratidesulfovibrio sp. SRB-5 TaxID=2872636 RepID=UPI00102759BE|nr:STAS domain-containing protein [Nitratidesulfovibrio sp. SRB-5]MBZ2170608.1 STAS domain-containing protein [Nitratidesulfovibrio sp. SRB-5]RXF76481.1 anti-sigma factor antagonist [Desulfovibrio sp. DS-1]
MQHTSTDRGGVTVLAFSGRMDATTVAAFDEAWRARLEAGANRLVIDLGGIEYISSAGLRGILGLLKACKSGGVGLAFCGIGEMVGEVFRISGFTGMLSIHPTADAAVAALA